MWMFVGCSWSGLILYKTMYPLHNREIWIFSWCNVCPISVNRNIRFYSMKQTQNVLLNLQEQRLPYR